MALPFGHIGLAVPPYRQLHSGISALSFRLIGYAVVTHLPPSLGAIIHHNKLPSKVSADNNSLKKHRKLFAHKSELCR